MARQPDMSIIENRPANVGLQFFERVAASGPRNAFAYPSGDDWTWVTWAQAGEKVERLAAGLLSLGIGREDRVGIAASTSYDWVIADLAIMASGGATTTVYPSTNPDDVAFILSDSATRIVIVEDGTQLAKLVDKRGELPLVEKVVTMSDGADGDWVITMDDLADRGAALLTERPGAVRDVVAEVPGDALATLIYTSGTTGPPKGVRLDHNAWTYEGCTIQALDILSEDDLQFLWLPLAHSFGKVLLTSQLACGFPTAVDGRVDKIIDNLASIKPTFMGAAPRIFEKAHGRIVTMQEQEGGVKKKIFDRAFKVGLAVAERQREGKAVPLGLRLQHRLFDKLVFSKIRERFGGRIRFFISGAAALNRDVARWFEAAGLQILEGYGLTESSAGTTVNLPWDNRIGTVGPALPGSELMIADDGEVLIKGPGVMDGYHNLPEATAEALDEDGWLHTGDIGELDADGYLRITDRKKDLFKTSGGKYIAPSQIESMFKAVCPYASQFVVHGNERKYCVALVTLDPDAMADWATHNEMEGKSYAEVVMSEPVHTMVDEYVNELNTRLNRWETIKKFRILDQDLSVEGGELTPSLKVKRRVVEDRHRELLDEMYDD